MKHKLTFFTFCILFCISSALIAQFPVHFKVNQADILESHAGQNHSVSPNSIIVLGDTPAASGGNPPYTYLWTPAYNLSDSTIANPVVTADSNITYTLLVTDSESCTSTSTVQIQIVSSIDNLPEIKENFSIYPNPVINNTFTLTAFNTQGDFTLSVKNLLGQEVLSKTLQGEGKHLIEIPLTAANSGGIFIVQVNAVLIYTFKIILL